jgi:hypothetical protein
MAVAAKIGWDSGVVGAHSERYVNIALRLLGVIAAIGLLAHLAVVFWARHEFTQVESVVALHVKMLVNGEGLYYDLNSYPFTVSPYGPIFYSLSSLTHRMGAPLFQGGRLLSVLALLVTLWSAWRVLRLLVDDPNARMTGVLLIASTSNILFWSTVGQVDMLACCFSLAAFVEFLVWCRRRSTLTLCLSGLFVILAIFTKQTAVASGMAIAMCLLVQDRRTAAWWIAGVAVMGLSVVIALDAFTAGRYLDNAIRANLNPFSATKLQAHLRYFLVAAGSLLVVVMVGVRNLSSRTAPLYLYAALAIGVFLATAPKIGSDLNYQIEPMLLLGLCAACTLDGLDFFRRWSAGDRTWITLLHLPLLLHILVNTCLTANALTERARLEPVKRAENAALGPFLEDSQARVISVQLDGLVHWRGRMEVEPLIYTLLVEAGMADPTAVRRDLADGRFQTVILYQDLFETRKPTPKNAEIPSLPPGHLDEIRRRYRLARHVEGPYLNGNYVYELRN